MIRRIFTFACIVLAFYGFTVVSQGCGQIGFPTGGVKDSLAPVLVKSSPEVKALNVTGNKINLTFDEYVEVVDAQNNVQVSPLPKSNPSINYNLKTVTVRLKDTLLPNTTYSINFGDAIKDVNEGNVFKNFTYVFSTGNSIDSAAFSGKVVLAETGLVDSTITVILYRNLADSAVQKLRPGYQTRIKGDGIFRFTNLPPGQYNVYALKDGDGNKYYNIKTELFAFHDSPVTIGDSSTPVTLYAYAEEKMKDNKTPSVLKPAAEKTFRYKASLLGTQDLLASLDLSFNRPLKSFDSNKIILTDTNYNKIAAVQYKLDSTDKILSLRPQVWTPGESYVLLVPKDGVTDTTGAMLAKSDTLRFKAKEEKEYARILLRFKGLDLAKNPVLQLVNNEQIAAAYPLAGNEWSNNMFPPGEYNIRILYDDNKDGVWTPGSYKEKRPPEKAITLPQKLSLRANWDNERDIELK
ncbi:MAG: Ig-like domain-containing domain [Ferruginibacter sp.]